MMQTYVAMTEKTHEKTHGEKVYLLTAGSGDDGDEWSLISIHRTKEGAEEAKKDYEKVRYSNKPGHNYTYHFEANDIEEWEVF
jgi:hypothetical protein